MRVIGLTGGIGVGKSTVAALLERLGATVIDADREGHLSYQSGTIGYEQVLALFGADVLGEDGEVDRKQLGRAVFGDPKAMAMLNSAVHPLIRQRVEARLEELRSQGAEVIVLDAALLYQAGWDDLVDEVWVVAAPPSVVVSRLRVRGLAERDVRQRMEMQDAPEALAGRADVVIENTGNLEELQAKVEKLWNEKISLIRQ